MFVANGGSGNVSVIDEATGLVAASIAVQSNPIGEAYDPSNGELYVVNHASNTVSVISVALEGVVTTVDVGSFPWGITYDSSNGDLYVTNNADNTVSVIAGSSNTVVDTISLAGSWTLGIAYDPWNNEVYVAEQNSNLVQAIDGTTNSIVGNVTMATPYRITIDETAGNVYVAEWTSDRVSVIDPETNTVAATIPTGSGAAAAVPDPVNGEVYIADALSDNLTVLDAATNAELGSIETGSGPIDAGLAQHDGLLYLTDSGSASVEVLTPLNPTWNEVCGGCGPTPGIGATMVYDPAVAGLLLYGGVNASTGVYSNDTWVYGSGGWYLLHPATSPPPLAYGAMAYDPALAAVVEFGGCSGGCSASPSSTTWEFAGGNWTAASPSTVPPGRWDQALAYAPSLTGLVMFGGLQGTTVLDDTWTFVGGQWSKLTPTESPPPTYGAGFSWNATGNFGLLYGGYQGSSAPGTPTQQTWGFAGGDWSLPPSEAAPAARVPVGQMATGPSPQGVLLFGGLNTTTGTLNDTWVFSGGVWAAAAGSPSPPGRWDGTLAYDPLAQAFVLFGGQPDWPSGPSTNDTWTFQLRSPAPPPVYTSRFSESGLPTGTSWSIDVGGSALSSTTASLLWNSVNGSYPYSVSPVAGYTSSPTAGTVVVDGAGASVSVLFSPTGLGSGWLNLTSTTGTAPVGGELVWDPYDGYLLDYGGVVNGSQTDATHALIGGRWTPVAASGSPPAVSGEGLAFDPAVQEVILYGGQTGCGASCGTGQTWGYQAGHWGELDPTNSPPSGQVAGMAWDPDESALVAFSICGNSGCSPGYNETWELNGNSWSLIGTASGPSGRCATADFYEPTQGNWMIFGGGNCFGVALGDTWNYSGRHWQEEDLSPNPPAVKGSPSGAFLLAQGYGLVFGGSESAGNSSQTWEYGAGGWSNVTGLSGAPPSPSSSQAMVYDPQMGTAILVDGSGRTWSWGSPSTSVQTTYSLTATATGLPADTPWSVRIGSSTVHSSDPLLTWYDPNGSYAYSVLAPAGYSVSPASGTWVVAGEDTQLNLTFTPILSAKLALSSTSLEAGLTLFVNSTVSGELVYLRYNWSAVPPGCASPGNVSHFACVVSATGTYPIHLVVVTGAPGFVSAWANVSVTAPVFSVSLAAVPPSLAVGGTLSLTASILGNPGTPSYSWTDLPGGCKGGNVATISCVPSGPGHWNTTVTITSSYAPTVAHNATVAISIFNPSPAHNTGQSSPSLFSNSAVLVVLVAAVVAGVALVLYVRSKRRASLGRLPASSAAPPGAGTDSAPPPPTAPAPVASPAPAVVAAPSAFVPLDVAPEPRTEPAVTCPECGASAPLAATHCPRCQRTLGAPEASRTFDPD